MATTVKVTREDWLFKDKIKRIIDKNVKTIPYEGDEVDKHAIIEEIVELLTSKEYSVLNHKKNLV